MTFRNHKIYAWIAVLPLLLGTVCFLSACSDDDPDRQDGGDVLRVLTYAPNYTEASAAPALKTVTVPENYESFATLYPSADETHPSLTLFMAQPSQQQSYKYRYEGAGIWNATSKVKQETYYLYGFYPSTAVTHAEVAPVSSDYANGAVISLTGLQSVTLHDLCFTVGVKGVERTTEDADVRLGNFVYTGQEKGKNFVYLLFDHLYAAYQFQMKTDAEYAKLRTIKLKQMKIVSSGSNSFDAEITLNNTESPVENISYDMSVATGQEVVLYDNTTTGQEITTAFENTGNMVCLQPSVKNNLSIVCVYDVYDRKGILVRKDCRAENKLSSLPIVRRGEKKTVRITINPTYLYQLSDPELDNPSMTIE